MDPNGAVPAMAADDTPPVPFARRNPSTRGPRRPTLTLPPELDGQTTCGAYELGPLVGQGGMAWIFRAQRPDDARPVALKILDPALVNEHGSPEHLERFVREARAGASVRHPNVVSVIDQGQCPRTGLHFIAFEFVDGQTLEDLLTIRGRLPESEALPIIFGVAQALSAIEAQGIVHRDVKPSNILLDQGGTPKLADLGMVKLLAEGGLTQSGAVLGTPHYIAPEQAIGMDAIDVRADLYALGITLFRLLTGHLPFEGDGFLDVVTRHVNEELPDPRSIDPAISIDAVKILVGLAARDPAERYPNARAAAEDIARALLGQPANGPPGADSVRTTRWAQGSNGASGSPAAAEDPPTARVRPGGRDPAPTPRATPGPRPADSAPARAPTASSPRGAVDGRAPASGATPRNAAPAPTAPTARPPAPGTRPPSSPPAPAPGARPSSPRNQAVPRAKAPTPVPPTRSQEQDELRVVVTTGSNTLFKKTFIDKRWITLGRDAKCDVQVDNPMVSRTHAELRRKGSAWEISDNGTTNGTFVNGDRVKAPVALSPGDLVTLAKKFKIELTWLPAQGSDTAAAPEPEAAAPVEVDEWHGTLTGDDEAYDPPTEPARPPSSRPAAAAALATAPSAPPPPSGGAQRPGFDWRAQATDLLASGPPSGGPSVPPAAPGKAPEIVGAVTFISGGVSQRVVVEDMFQIGKASECGLRLEGPYSPRKAVVIARFPGGWRLLNVAPFANTVQINGATAEDVAVLRDGDKITAYGVELMFSISPPG